MKIVCSQESLAQGLSVVGRAVAPRSTLPVLGNILLAADGSRLKLAATTLDMGITCWLDAEVAAEGAITAPARLLADFVGSLPKDRVELTLSRSGSLNLRCATYEANVRGIDADEFPSIAEPTDGSRAQVDPKTLHEAIQQVAFAAATDDTRPALTGVLLSFRGSTLTLAAADGFRLAVRSIDLPQPAPESLDVIVPARALHELARVLGGQEEPVEVSVTESRSQALFHLKDVQLVTRLIAAAFPNYQAIMPTSYSTRVSLPTKDFQNAVRIASLFARDAQNIVRLEIQAGSEAEQELKPGRLQVLASATDVGDTTGGIDAVVQGTDAEIAFNVKYLADVLGIISTAQVSLEVTSPSRPGVVRPVGESRYTYVIMPIHVTTTARSAGR